MKYTDTIAVNGPHLTWPLDSDSGSIDQYTLTPMSKFNEGSKNATISSDHSLVNLANKPIVSGGFHCLSLSPGGEVTFPTGNFLTTSQKNTSQSFDFFIMLREAPSYEIKVAGFDKVFDRNDPSQNVETETGIYINGSRIIFRFNIFRDPEDTLEVSTTVNDFSQPLYIVATKSEKSISVFANGNYQVLDIEKQYIEKNIDTKSWNDSNMRIMNKSRHPMFLDSPSLYYSSLSIDKISRNLENAFSSQTYYDFLDLSTATTFLIDRDFESGNKYTKTFDGNANNWDIEKSRQYCKIKSWSFFSAV